MKIYDSNIAQKSGHILWCFCLYAIIGIIFKLTFYLTDATLNTIPTFVIIASLALGQAWRLHKMHYRIAENALIQYDFHYRTLFIEQIVEIHVLKKMRWISFHSPYNIVIETMDKEKYYMAPEDVETMVDILKKENPDILVTR